jgi:hypothetical protein
LKTNFQQGQIPLTISKKKYWPALKVLGEERKDIEQQVRELL